MSKDKAVDPDTRVLSNFKDGMARWASAVQAHKQAPPDLNFADRLGALARGAADAARVCGEADAAGFQWPPARKADSEPPYELRPGTGRRGPDELWRRFDQTITRLSTMAAGQDMGEVAHAYKDLAAIAGELAEAVEGEDRASVGRTRRARARRSA
jgi:hypothetical protein